MSLNILITGASGMLGATLVDKWKNKYDVYATDKLDFENAPEKNFLSFDLLNESYKELIDWSLPDVIVHCGAITDVDYCEKHPKHAMAVNADSVKKMLKTATDARMLFISSDAVLPDRVYKFSETDQTFPGNMYGMTKEVGESFIKDVGKPHVSIRTTIVGKNINSKKSGFVDWIVHSVLNKKEIILFEDALFTPITIWHFGDELEWVIENDVSGVIHIAGTEAISKFDFGRRVCEGLGLDTSLIKRGSINDVDLKAKRVKDQTLDSGNFQRLSSRVLPSAQDSIDMIVQQFSAKNFPDIAVISETFPIPYVRQSVSESDIANVCQVLRSEFLTQGSKVPKFEAAVAQKVRAKYAVAVNSATSALHVACKALDLGPGDHLWTSPNTFVASANCALYCGAKVDFVDIEPHTWNLSACKLEKKLQHHQAMGKPLPKIVVPVHFSGQPTQQERLLELAQEFGFKILEDASHSIGASRNGEPVGSCRWSDIAVFSFHPTKIITSGEGGMLLTNDPELAWKMDMLRTSGVTRNANRLKMKSLGPWYYEQQELGFNYRMSDIHAALGLSQLSLLEEFMDRRNTLAKNYNALLDNLPLKCPTILLENVSSFHLYVVRLLTNDNPRKHRKVFEGLRAAGIGVNLHYMPVHLQPYYRSLGFEEGQFPESEAYGREALSLPLYPNLSKTEQTMVVEQLRQQLTG